MTHYADTHPRARKPHSCDMCRRTIRTGETYRRSAGMDGTSAWTWIECAHCEPFARFAYSSRGWDEGYDETLLIDFEPVDVAQARVLAQYRRRWQRRDGGLCPVPELIIREDKYGFGRPVDIKPGAEAA